MRKRTIPLQGIWPNLYLRISYVYASANVYNTYSIVDTLKTAKF